MENLPRILETYIESKKFPGIEWIIKLDEKKYSGSIGYLNLENKEKLNANCSYRIWSMTKPIISIVILQLIEEKKIKFEDPINLYLPSFNNLKVLKQNAKSIEDIKNVENNPTIKDLLLHTAGFSYNFLGDIIAEEYHNIGLFYSNETTLEKEIDTLSNIPLLYEPGTRWVYSVSVDILARIIEVVENTSLEFQLKKRIFDPLEMHNTGFSINVNNQKLMKSYHYNNVNKKLVKPDVNPRYISNYGYPINGKNFARGGIGLFSTANDYLLFADMLQTGLSQKGEKIISIEMLKNATQNQISKSFLPYQIKNFDIKVLDENVFDPYGWGYGFRVHLQNNNFNNKGEFGWGGAANTYFLVDPKYKLSAVLMTQVFQGDPNLHKDFYNYIYSQL
tara:strand:+ start:381 stop:1553 length:1173 start_codon:yes stop_codon:yes gene_type:complete